MPMLNFWGLPAVKVYTQGRRAPHFQRPHRGGRERRGQNDGRVQRIGARPEGHAPRAPAHVPSPRRPVAPQQQVQWDNEQPAAEQPEASQDIRHHRLSTHEHWQHQRRLGSGAEGEVHLFRTTAFPGHQLVAVKMMRTRERGTPFEARLLQRFQAWGGHENIIGLLRVDIDQPGLLNGRQRETRMILEYCRNGTLHDDAQRKDGLHTSYSEHELWLILSQLISAFAFLHDAVGRSTSSSSVLLHRDLKPDNILVKRRDQNYLVVKVADFGHSAFSENAAQSWPVGSPMWQPYGGGRPSSRSNDIWSIGAVLHALVHGQEPVDMRSDHVVQMAQARGSWWMLYLPRRAMAIDTPPQHRRSQQRRPYRGNRTGAIVYSATLNAVMMQLLDMDADQRPRAATLMESIAEPFQELVQQGPGRSLVATGIW